MSFDFLKNYGAKRVREFSPQPLLLSDGANMGDNTEDEVGLNYERNANDWSPRSVTEASLDDSLRPRRFIDGKDSGRTVAWLRSREGFPVPIRLSEVGAVALRTVENAEGQLELRREWHKVERVVTFITDLFPWDEVEDFAIALRENGFRLLPCQIPSPQSNVANDESNEKTSASHQSLHHLFDFERMRRATQNRSSNEMLRCEREALSCCPEEPTVVDGLLKQRVNAFDTKTAPIIGLIKNHSTNYLHPQGWRTFYDLQPGERTPAFSLESEHMNVVTWYLRLNGASGEMPNYGVVRAEVTQPFFEGPLNKDWGILDGISRLLCDYRCRSEGYSRAPVSLHPIQRAEESLGALFTSSDTLISRFYRLANL